MYRIARTVLLAVPALAITVSTSTQSSTFTHYGCSTQVACTPHSGLVPTSTVCSVVHSTHTIEQVCTTTPVTTVQGRPTTSTITSTSTVTLTEPTITGTYTSTSTIENTITTTVATITVTQTAEGGPTVTSTSTSTITQPAPSGYVPITDSTGEQNPSSSSSPPPPKKARSPVDSRRQPAAERGLSRALPLAKAAGKGALPLAGDDRYPQQVLCTLTVETDYTIHSTHYAPTHTVTKPGSTVTTTSTVISTSTLNPSATTTVTSTSTSIVTSSATETDTSTTTTTATVTVSTTTSFYAACATNYLLGPNLSNGQGVFNFVPANDDYLDVLNAANTAYDCCVACQTSTGVCYGIFFGGGSCFLIQNDMPTGPGGVCSPTYDFGNIELGTAPGDYTVANGPCGALGPPLP